KTYYFRITALDNTGFENDYSNEVNATSGPPMYLTAISGIHEVMLHWGKDDRTNIMRYHIYGDTLLHPITLLDSTIGGVTDTTKILFGLAKGITYHFRIVAVDSTGVENDYSNEPAAIPGLFLPNVSSIPGNGQVLLN